MKYFRYCLHENIQLLLFRFWCHDNATRWIFPWVKNDARQIFACRCVASVQTSSAVPVSDGHFYQGVMWIWSHPSFLHNLTVFPGVAAAGWIQCRCGITLPSGGDIEKPSQPKKVCHESCGSATSCLCVCTNTSHYENNWVVYIFRQQMKNPVTFPAIT